MILMMPRSIVSCCSSSARSRTFSQQNCENGCGMMLIPQCCEKGHGVGSGMSMLFDVVVFLVGDMSVVGTLNIPALDQLEQERLDAAAEAARSEVSRRAFC